MHRFRRRALPVYPAAGEGRWLALAVRDGSDWPGLAAEFGRCDWAADPSLASADARRARRAEIDAAIAAWARAREAGDAERPLGRHPPP